MYPFRDDFYDYKFEIGEMVKIKSRSLGSVPSSVKRSQNTLSPQKFKVTGRYLFLGSKMMLSPGYVLKLVTVPKKSKRTLTGRHIIAKEQDLVACN